MSGSDENLVGQTLLGKLRCIRRIGKGGMGSVYEVEHLLTHHRRALKVLHADFRDEPEIVARFVREAGVAGTLESPYVVDIYDAGQLENGAPYVLMELLSGEPLSMVIKREKRMEPARAASIMAQVCDGIAAAHAMGIVHRDLKPDNIYLVHGDDGERVKILDFGISKFGIGGHTNAPHTNDEALTMQGVVMGTPWYMAPEQAQGRADVDERADIYAIGVILYQMLTGQRPFDGDNYVVLALKIYQGEYVPLQQLTPYVHHELTAIVDRAMARERRDRFSNALELSHSLRSCKMGVLPDSGEEYPVSPVEGHTGMSIVVDDPLADEETSAPLGRSHSGLPTSMHRASLDDESGSAISRARRSGAGIDKKLKTPGRGTNPRMSLPEPEKNNLLDHVRKSREISPKPVVSDRPTELGRASAAGVGESSAGVGRVKILPAVVPQEEPRKRSAWLVSGVIGVFAAVGAAIIGIALSDARSNGPGPSTADAQPPRQPVPAPPSTTVAQPVVNSNVQATEPPPASAVSVPPLPTTPEASNHGSRGSGDRDRNEIRRVIESATNVEQNSASGATNAAHSTASTAAHAERVTEPTPPPVSAETRDTSANSTTRTNGRNGSPTRVQLDDDNPYD